MNYRESLEAMLQRVPPVQTWDYIKVTNYKKLHSKALRLINSPCATDIQIRSMHNIIAGYFRGLSHDVF